MESTNNYVPTIVERAARRATRYVCNGLKTMKYLKSASHRSYRRMMNKQMHCLENGFINYDDDYNDEPGHCKCTSYDIW